MIVLGSFQDSMPPWRIAVLKDREASGLTISLTIQPLTPTVEGLYFPHMTMQDKICYLA